MIDLVAFGTMSPGGRRQSLAGGDGADGRRRGEAGAHAAAALLSVVAHDADRLGGPAPRLLSDLRADGHELSARRCAERCTCTGGRRRVGKPHLVARPLGGTSLSAAKGVVATPPRPSLRSGRATLIALPAARRVEDAPRRLRACAWRSTRLCCQSTASISVLMPEPMPSMATRSSFSRWPCSMPIAAVIGSATEPVLPRCSTVAKSAAKRQAERFEHQLAMGDAHLMAKRLVDSVGASSRLRPETPRSTSRRPARLRA